VGLQGDSRILLPRALELQTSDIYYASPNVPQSRERPRSSFHISATQPFINERAEFVFTFTDVFNDFALQHEMNGQGFWAAPEGAGRTRGPQTPLLRP
jgi:hypothetical protein